MAMSQQMNSPGELIDIFHLASPINLQPDHTTVLLSDYFIDTSRITNVAVCDDLIAKLSPDKKTLDIVVLHDTLPSVSVMLVSVGGREYGIVLKKSRKLKHKLYFNPNGAHHNAVQIAGSLNSWNPQNHYFKHVNGQWEIELYIEPGIYTYQLIADGNWFTDPANPMRVDNGYGGYNSVLEIKTPYEDLIPEISAELSVDRSIVIHSSQPVKQFIALWQNEYMNNSRIFVHDFKAMVTLPQSAENEERSFLRVWAYNEFGASNDLLIPLEYGKPVTSTSQLTRDDKEAGIVYFILVDRFMRGTPVDGNAIKDADINERQNYYGGDIAGIIQKSDEGYFDKLGVNTLWVSPVVQNPNTPCEKNGVKTMGYHGYWPLISTAVDYRFGTRELFAQMVHNMHEKGINVLLDYVSNHIHEGNPVFKLNPEWSTPLYLSDGSLNVGRWEDQRFSTWFDEFLPTLDYDKPEVVDTMTEFAVFWVDQFNLDGFRHDATKHIPNVFWRKLTEKLKKGVMIPKGKRLYQIGESFGGREMLKEYINSGMLDGQFSFNLYYELRAAFAFDEEPFTKLAVALEQDLKAFGYHNLMGNITGNHDMPRFISYAGGDLSLKENAEHEGWQRDITVKNLNGYRKLSALTAFICTIPGIPVIYYGDEIGMPGGGDPDNRRPMRFENLSVHEKQTLDICSKIIHLRRDTMSLNYGSYHKMEVTGRTFVFNRSYLDEVTFCAFNKGHEEREIVIPIEVRYRKLNFKANFGHEFTNEIYYLRTVLKPYSFEIFTSYS